MKSKTQPNRQKAAFATSIFLLLGFCVALWLRVIVGRPDVSHSATAGLLFAACLVLLSVATGIKVNLNRKVLYIGLAGGAFLCLPAVFMRIISGNSHVPQGNYFIWSAIVTIVALAEEVFLRGVWYDAVAKASNQIVAVLLAAVAFTALHIPLYGWHAVPLDFAVGLWLGALRYTSGSVAAPGIAHVLADLIAWWI